MWKIVKMLLGNLWAITHFGEEHTIPFCRPLIFTRVLELSQLVPISIFLVVNRHIFILAFA